MRPACHLASADAAMDRTVDRSVSTCVNSLILASCARTYRQRVPFICRAASRTRDRWSLKSRWGNATWSSRTPENGLNSDKFRSDIKAKPPLADISHVGSANPLGTPNCPKRPNL